MILCIGIVSKKQPIACKLEVGVNQYNQLHIVANCNNGLRFFYAPSAQFKLAVVKIKSRLEFGEVNLSQSISALLTFRYINALVLLRLIIQDSITLILFTIRDGSWSYNSITSSHDPVQEILINPVLSIALRLTIFFF
jgi:hypothetical protein